MSTKTFSPVNPSFNFAETDRATLEFWEKNKICEKSEKGRNQGRYFVFYDGPPGTNGQPHIGHIMQSALKDVWPRFKTMQGYTVIRKAGWDTHGLPVELTAEAELGLSGKKQIEEYGIEKFVEHCRKTVLRFRSDWVTAITRLGRFADFENDYLTMSNDFIQSDWWVLKTAFEKKLLYKDYKIVPYCCRCGTGLSSHEVAQGYRDITDLTLTAKFALKGEAHTFILAWTTTPWTLLGNVALAVGGEIEYSKVKTTKDGKTEYLLLATETIKANEQWLGEGYEVVGTVKGSALVGKSYEPLWQQQLAGQGKIHEIVADDYVTTSDGTGVVHLALYGEDDYRLIKKNGFVQNQHVGADGRCQPQCGAYAGRFFREEGLDVDIVKDLAARGLLFEKHRYEHSYPHCWRCKTPLMYFAKSSWFIKTTAYKDVMIEQNNTINWHPPHIKEGRFGNWLENNVDWAVSRERYWGSPINIWTNEKDSSKQICAASIAELQKLGAYMESSGKPVPDNFDLHIPYINDVVIKDKDGSIYRREIGVLDCWFNAGVMPWGQFGYPAKPGSEEIFKTQFPADFICEAIDQTRGWFYTLLAVSCLVSGKTPFKNVICTDHILDSKGKKMSKSLGNVIAPLPLIQSFGADAVRWTFYNSNPWLVTRYSEDLPKEALRAVLIPLWNCYSFFVTYALIDGWKPSANRAAKSSIELDRWLVSAFGTTAQEVTEALESYDIARASGAIAGFIDLLSNWYIRRSRKRFWKSENDQDKNSAYETLYRVLVDLSKLIAPLTPFIAEVMYQNLVRPFDDSAQESVHLCEWVDYTAYPREQTLEEEIAVIQEAASLGRALRVEHDLKVRQPLSQLLLSPSDKGLAKRLANHLDSLAEEINVKAVEVVTDAATFVDLNLKPNWRALGPKFGDRMKQLGAAIQKVDARAVGEFAGSGILKLTLDGEAIELTREDVVLEQKARPGMVAQAGRNVTVALRTELTPELILEGDARELVSLVQKQRKTLNFEISDYISAKFLGGKRVEEILGQHKDYIQRECLIRDLSYSYSEKPAAAQELNGQLVAFELARL